MLSFCCLAVTCILSAQTERFYYTFNEKKIRLRVNNNKSILLLNDAITQKNIDFLQGYEKIGTNAFIVPNDLNFSLFADYNIIPSYFIESSSQEIYYTNELVLKYKDNMSAELIHNIEVEFGLSIVQKNSIYNLYTCKQDALSLSNKIYEKGIVEFCTPNFITKTQNYSYPNDTYFNKQWYLHNTGQGTNDNKTTTPDADIDALEAWQITKGSPNVIVAVIDEGITNDHPDLPLTRQVRLPGSNFAYQYDGSNNPNDPSPTLSYYSGNNHGNACAGIIAATQGNNEGITGIAPLCKIMPIKIPFGNAPANIYADAITFAVNNNADILSNSWGYNSNNPNLIPVIVSAINNAVSKGKLVVFAAGNTADKEHNNNGFVTFPACSNISDLVVVGASDRNNKQANYSPKSSLIDIAAPSHTAYNSQINGESFNIWTIDIPGAQFGYNNWRDDANGLPAVGEILPNYGGNNTAYTGRMGGTSAACPQVAAVLALIKSIDPNITSKQALKILFTSADKVGKYNYYKGHSSELGYGKLNAYTAVRMAKGLVAPADLYVRDSVGDIGDEPSGFSRLWASPDIWIEDMAGNRVNPYGDDDYNVCVRIHNRSDSASLGNERLLLNWAKAGIDLNWSGSWTGEEFFICKGKKVPKGGYVGDINGVVIPSIPAHSNYIIKVKWHVPKPEDYIGCSAVEDQLRHFCLLARVYDGHPILHENESSESVRDLVRDNNNVAWRNVTILEGKQNRGAVSVGNSFKEPRTFSLLYSLRENELGELLYKYADVYLNMSSNLFELWQKSDFAGKGFKVVDKNKILLTEPTATIERLVLQPEELYLLEAEVNFFTQEEPENNEFVFDIAEYIDDENEGKELIGGETYIAIRNPERDSYFKAKAVDDKTVLPAEPVSFRAEPISEDAVYTWFDQKGDTVAHGLNLTVTPTSTQHYKLEVVATADGFKDYDSVRATVRNGAIVSLSPNPTDNQLTITYRLAAGITNATIEISDVQNLSVQSYPVTAAATTKTVSLAGLTAGTYVVKLIINGETVDTRQVIKN